LRSFRWNEEDTMVHTMTVHSALAGIGRFLEHAASVVVGLILMILGLGLGVTMIMLPVGIAIGLLGTAIVVAGIFARIDKRS
jgi:hypothetical protein